MNFLEGFKLMREGKEIRSLISDRILCIRHLGPDVLCFYEVAKDHSGYHSTSVFVREVQGDWEDFGKNNWSLADNVKEFERLMPPKSQKLFLGEDIKTFIQKVKDDIKNLGMTSSVGLEFNDKLFEIIDKRSGGYENV